MPNSILEISALSFGYAHQPLLFDDFSLTVQKGEIVALTGASGSGKSTLLELITGGLKPKRGVIKAARFSQIFQDPYTSFHHSYTIANQINDVAPNADPTPLCEKVGVDPALLTRKAHTLSGGQLQRLSIVRALLMKPELILADEPTSALDNLTQLEVMKLLISLLQGVGILLITHDTSMAAWCADRVINISRQP